MREGNMKMISNDNVGLSVMVTTLKMSPATVLIVPEMRREGEMMHWEGAFQMRTRGVPGTEEGRQFLCVLLRSALENLEETEQGG